MQMVIIMRENSKMESLADMVNLLNRTEIFMRVSGRTVSLKVRGNLFKLMDLNIMVASRMD